MSSIFPLILWRTLIHVENFFFFLLKLAKFMLYCLQFYRLLTDASIYCSYNEEIFFFFTMEIERLQFNQLFFGQLFLRKVRVFTFPYYGRAEIWRGFSIMKWEHERWEAHDFFLARTLWWNAHKKLGAFLERKFIQHRWNSVPQLASIGRYRSLNLWEAGASSLKIICALHKTACQNVRWKLDFKNEVVCSEVSFPWRL